MSENDEPEEPPFTQAILTTSIYSRGKFSRFDKYDGSADPVDCVVTYESLCTFTRIQT